MVFQFLPIIMSMIGDKKKKESAEQDASTADAANLDAEEVESNDSLIGDMISNLNKVQVEQQAAKSHLDEELKGVAEVGSTGISSNAQVKALGNAFSLF